MPQSHSNPGPTWIGLLLGEFEHPLDADVIRQILGNDARMLLVGPHESPFATVHRMVGSGASSVVAVVRDEGASALAPLLRVASSLASFRRIVVIHDAAEMESLIGLPGIVLLRDCPEIRSYLRDLVQHDTAVPAAASVRRTGTTDSAAPSHYRSVARSPRPNA